MYEYVNEKMISQTECGGHKLIEIYYIIKAIAIVCGKKIHR